MSISLKAYLLGAAAAATLAITGVAVAAPDSGPTSAQVMEQRVSYDLGYQAGLEGRYDCQEASKAEFLFADDPVLHPGPLPHSSEDYMAGCYDGALRR
jgi:hypothetical protein